MALELDASLNDHDASDDDADALEDHRSLNVKQACTDTFATSSPVALASHTHSFVCTV